MDFRSKYNTWTVMRMKTKLRECEGYIRVFLEMDLSIEERGKEGKNTEDERRDTEGEITVDSIVTEKRSCW